MTQNPTEPKIGDKMDDGTIYAGISPDTGEEMYMLSRADHSLMKDWKAARRPTLTAPTGTGIGDRQAIPS
jgi:hypothetical protein